MYDEFFSKRLTQLRMEKGVSARDMSLTLGQSESYINRIENGKMLPSMTVFFYICDYLGISPEEFFSTKSASIELSQLINNLYTLTPDQIFYLTKLINDIKK